LKGGDPFVFGRGGEEASALAEAGIPFEVVPGISSAIAVPAYAGIPLTDRRSSSSFTVVTGHRGKHPEDSRTDWEGLARSSETLVVLMGTAWVEDITSRVIRGGRSPDTPAAVISHGTTGLQRTVRAPLSELARCARDAEIGPPAIIVIGQVAELRDSLAWYERRPLFGRRVLVLRSDRDGPDRLAVALCAAGAVPVAVPLIELVPAADGGQALDRALARLDRFDWLILTSAATVEFLVTRVKAQRASPRPPRIACIGSATTRAARGAGLDVVCAPEGRAGPDALLEYLGEVRGQRVLIPRSEQASEVLPERLIERGAVVECVTAYRNVVPDQAAEGLERALSERVDAILLTSPSSFERLVALRGIAEMRALAARIPWVCIGETTAQALRATDVRVAAVAERTTLEGLVEELERYYVSREESGGLS